MKKIILLIIIVTFSALFANSTNLFISEYIEGSGHNKALEIFNGTENNIDLSSYKLLKISNGGEWEEAQEYQLNGIIENNNVFIVGNSNANQELLDVINDSNWQQANWNGDDAIGLFNLINNEWVLIDLIGTNGPDPGQGWNVAAVDNATKNHTLVRKSSIMSGNTDWESSAGTNEINSEWIVYPENTFDYIGSHTLENSGNQHPNITNIQISPENPQQNDLVTISADIQDDNSIANVTLFWGTENNSLINEINMSITNAPTYSTDTQIPTQNQGITVYYKIIATDNEELTTESSILSYSIPIPTQNLTITQIQGTENDSPYIGQSVQTSGIVTSRKDNLMSIQNDSAPYNGIWITGNNQANIGDSITVTGIVQEYYSLTEIIAEQIIINSNNNPLPSPLEITTLQVSEEQYEGVLVNISNAVCIEAPDNYGEWKINNGGNENDFCIVDDLYYTFDAIVGNNYGVQGIISYSFNNYKLEPRNENDININSDITPPSISEYTIISNTEIDILFNEEIEQISAENIDNYSFSNNIQIISATKNDSIVSKINLIVNSLEEGEFTLTISNIKDLYNNIMETTILNFNYFSPLPDRSLVINEIHYDPSVSQGNDNDFEFIELFNNSNETINLTGFSFSGIDFTFENSEILAGEFIVIAKNQNSYNSELYNTYGNYNGSLSNSGETITLFDPLNRIVDEVNYNNNNTWPSSANGNGPSLELISADSDNNIPTNWQASFINNGTPGILNSNPISEVTITFQLSLGEIPINENGVHIMGSFNNWNPNEIIMNDENNNQIYTTELLLTPNQNIEYKFINGNSIDNAETTTRTLTIPTENTILPVAVFSTQEPPVSSLIFSEYIEGLGQNKAIEIYNSTDIEAQLSSYRIIQYKHSSSGDQEIIYQFAPNLIIPENSTYCIVAEGADETLINNANIVLSYPSIVHFNGDDALYLQQSNENNIWETIDVIGVENITPEEGYQIAEIEGATKNHTIVRKSNILNGNTNWENSAGTNNENSEWIIYPVDTFTYFGTHTTNQDLEAPTIVSITVNSQTELNINFNEPLGETSAELTSNYTISSGISVISAILDNNNPSKVDLTVSTMNPGNYILTVTNISDLYNNHIVEETASFIIEEIGDLPQVEISEIFYNPPSNLGDDSDYEFLELHNSSNTTADISNFSFSAGIEYTFPENTTLEPDEYLILTPNAESYDNNQYTVLQWQSGALSNEGEEITIIDPLGRILDTVTYFNEGDWPSGANGGGSSLELINPNSDNSIPSNWQASFIVNGTPGTNNSTEPNPTEYTITQLQTEDHTNEYIRTEGQITAIFNTGNYWLATIQNGTGEYSGIWIKSDSEISASLYNSFINIIGTVTEFYDLTLIYSSSIQVSNANLPEIVPENLQINQATTEPWEGVLIKVNGLCTNINPDGENDYGEWEISYENSSLRIDDLGYEFEPELNRNYSVTGVLNYSFSNFKLEPRNENDIIIGTDNNEAPKPLSFTISPNPFNPTTNINFNLAESGNVKIVIFNIKGQKVKELVDRNFNHGQHSVSWDGKNSSNQQNSTGIYLVKFTTKNYTKTSKMIMLK